MVLEIKIMPATRTAIALAIMAVTAGLPLSAQNATPGQSVAAPLSVGQVVDNLVRKNQERAQALAHSEATRVYRLSYRGFPGDREAEMTVEATYQSPSTKSFKIVSESGSKVIVDHVFKKLLEGELEAAQPETSARTQLTRENYEFRLEGYEPSESGGQYLLNVIPKSKSKFVYRGKIWVDARDFAVVRIEAEPAQNPSFWTKKSEIHHEYQKVEDFWLPKRNESVSFVRLGGRATLTIEYSNYRLTSVAPQESDSRTTAASGGSD